MKNFIIINIFFTCLFIPSVNAQELVSSASGTKETSGYIISWSLGEPFINTLINNETVLTQGFHQTRLTVTNVHNFTENRDIKVFPVPAKEYIIIRTGSRELMHFSLLNLKGEKILTGDIRSPEVRLDMTTVTNGIYILSIYDHDQTVIQNMKVIKQE